MNATGWLCRIVLAALIVVILTVVVSLGWASISWPGLVFYAGAALVGLLAWWDFRRSGAKRGPEDQTGADEMTAPGYHDSITKG